MNKAGYALETVKQSEERQTIYHFIEKQIDHGMSLPIDTREALLREITEDIKVLRILYSSSRNKQIIPVDLMKTLVNMFNPENDEEVEKNCLLIGIFENAAKNNQGLSTNLIEKMSIALERKSLEKAAFPLFIYLAQKGQVLSQQVNQRLLDKLMNLKQDPVLKQELLSALGSLIWANSQEINLYREKIRTILIKEISSDNHNVLRLCVNAIGKFIKVVSQVDLELLEPLVRVGTDQNTDKIIRFDIQMLFENISEEGGQMEQMKRRVKLANLKANSNIDILAILESQADHDHGFLPQVS